MKNAHQAPRERGERERVRYGDPGLVSRELFEDALSRAKEAERALEGLATTSFVVGFVVGSILTAAVLLLGAGRL